MTGVGAEGLLVGVAEHHLEGVLVVLDEPDDLLEQLLREVGEVGEGVRRDGAVHHRRVGGRDGLRVVGVRNVRGIRHLDQHVEEGLVRAHPVVLRRDVGQRGEGDPAEHLRGAQRRLRGQPVGLHGVDVQLTADVDRELKQRDVLRGRTRQVTLGAERRDLAVECSEPTGRAGQRTAARCRDAAVLVLAVESVRAGELVLGARERPVAAAATGVGEDHHTDHRGGVDDVVVAVGVRLLEADLLGGAAGDVGAFAVADDRELRVGARLVDRPDDRRGVLDTAVDGVLVRVHVRRIVHVHGGVRLVADHVTRRVDHRIDPVAAVLVGAHPGQHGAVGGDHPLALVVRRVAAATEGDTDHVVAGPGRGHQRRIGGGGSVRLRHGHRDHRGDSERTRGEDTGEDPVA